MNRLTLSTHDLGARTTQLVELAVRCLIPLASPGRDVLHVPSVISAPFWSAVAYDESPGFPTG